MDPGRSLWAQVAVFLWAKARRCRAQSWTRRCRVATAAELYRRVA